MHKHSKIKKLKNSDIENIASKIIKHTNYSEINFEENNNDTMRGFSFLPNFQSIEINDKHWEEKMFNLENDLIKEFNKKLEINKESITIKQKTVKEKLSDKAKSVFNNIGKLLSR